ncbi:MAG TPA: translation initiation factor IF-3 [bacterium]|nr:translation initiation factor IF-3 [bacterium]
MNKFFNNKNTSNSKKYRINNQIRVDKVFVIGSEGEKLGLMNTFQAITKAQEMGFDLIEVSPNSNPPVCKIGDFGQFQYNLSKKQKTNKPKKVEIKGIRLSLTIGKHDLEVKRNQAKKFLSQKDKVKIELILRGREKQYIEKAKGVINEFLSEIQDQIAVEQNVAYMAGRLSMIIKSK